MLPTTMVRTSFTAGIAIIAGALTAGAQAQVTGAESLNMQLVGYDDLQGRSAYQPIVHEQGGRFIAYIGHHAGRHLNPLTGREEGNGTSILDVTDPANPVYLHHIPGADLLGDESEAQMVRACAGSDLRLKSRPSIFSSQ